MPSNHLVAAFSQALLHKLAIQAATAHRLASSRGSSATRTNGSRTRSNIFQVRFMATEQRTHNACRAHTGSARGSRTACINLVHSTHIRLLRQADARLCVSLGLGWPHILVMGIWVKRRLGQWRGTACQHGSNTEQ